MRLRIENNDMYCAFRNRAFYYSSLWFHSAHGYILGSICYKIKYSSAYFSSYTPYHLSFVMAGSDAWPHETTTQCCTTCYCLTVACKEYVTFIRHMYTPHQVPDQPGYDEYVDQRATSSKSLVDQAIISLKTRPCILWVITPWPHLSKAFAESALCLSFNALKIMS